MPTLSALPDHAVIGLSGPDAMAFAQAQFANDVAMLMDGHWQWNCWLTPKGRVLAVFALLRHAADEVQLIVPDYHAEQLVIALQRYVLRRKVSLGVRADLVVEGSFHGAIAAPDARIRQQGAHWMLDFSGAGGGRWLRIGPATGASPDEDFVRRWRDFDLRHGLARLAQSQLDRWTPQQLSLDRLQAFSVRKGCYPGQEIVARTHFLGKAKRELVLLGPTRAVEAAAPVHDGSALAGEIVSVVDGALPVALAVLAMDRGAHLRSDDVELAPLPLLDGLGRTPAAAG